MRYASIFFTILLIWLAVILMALTHRNPSEIFQLFLTAIGCTIVLFVIGFAKK